MKRCEHNDYPTSCPFCRIAALESELAQARAECERLMKLVMAVGNKYPGESRYDTAMRYIVEAETRASGPGQSAARKEGT